MLSDDAAGPRGEARQPRRTPLLALGGVVLLAGAVIVATVVTVSGDRKDPACRDPVYGCAEFLAGEPIPVGLLTTLSGPGSLHGIDARRGVELAIDRFGGRVAGRPIHLRVQDDGCSTKGAAQGARELASDPPYEPPVVAVVGPVCAGGTQAAAQILSDSGITLFTWNAAPVSFQDPERSFLAVAALGSPTDAFGRAFAARFGERPQTSVAWLAFSATRRILEAADRLAVRGADGSVLVPRLPLHRAISAV